MRKIERGLSMNLPGSPLSLPWESGAEDARTPDASRLPGVSEPREAFGVRPIYRRFPPARDGQRFMAAMHDLGIVELFRGDEVPRPSSSLRQRRLSQSLLTAAATSRAC